MRTNRQNRQNNYACSLKFCNGKAIVKKYDMSAIFRNIVP